MRGGRGIFAVVLALSVGVAACSNTDAGPTPTPTGESTTSAAVTTVPVPMSTTTVAPTSTTSLIPAGVELPDNFGDDYRYVWDEIQGFIDQLSVEPHSDLVELVIDPECECFSFWLDLFQELEDNDWRYTGDGFPETVEFRVISELSDSEVLLFVAQEGEADAVVDSDGNVVREEEAQQNQSSILIRRNEEGRWLVLAVDGS